ncbi:MAG: ABC transporter ATP-binding protein [Chitinophagaceae bacterium]|jgi:ABC-2 type transport system ATP-binding protein|nr:ABC transporter ATP-binding protein [Chitinophagaceae bacterium]
MIQFKDFKKQYSEFTALNIPSFEIKNGLYWLKGINGSGKTTLLKTLGGIIPFEGSLLIEELDILKHKRAHRKIVNYAEAEPVFPEFLTAMDLIDFFVSTKGGSKEKCLQQLEMLNMKPELNKKTVTYSSGMMKKLSLALAFIGTPKWILLDEPLITLDVSATEAVTQWIEEEAHNGVSFLLTSHQPILFKDRQPSILNIENRTIAQQ